MQWMVQGNQRLAAPGSAIPRRAGAKQLLSESGWFTAGHMHGAVVNVIVKQLGKARHQRLNVLYMVVVPRLMTG
jgi:hypothetical protein